MIYFDPYYAKEPDGQWRIKGEFSTDTNVA